jgi:hypothetical protein
MRGVALGIDPGSSDAGDDLEMIRILGQGATDDKQPLKKSAEVCRSRDWTRGLIAGVVEIIRMTMNLVTGKRAQEKEESTSDD